MLILFIISLFLTFLIVRTIAYSFHDMKNYGTKKEKSKTITGWLRIKTGFDWHHFHFGGIIFIISLTLILIIGLNKWLTILLAIGISMLIDQAVPIVDRKSNYFHIKNFIISLIFHIVVAIFAFLIYTFS